MTFIEAMIPLPELVVGVWRVDRAISRTAASNAWLAIGIAGPGHRSGAHLPAASQRRHVNALSQLGVDKAIDESLAATANGAATRVSRCGGG